MRYMSSKEIRETWLKYFEKNGHLVEPSASLIPVNDPTLLWINAGVAPLKKYFEGSETPKSKRIVNIQKSIRTNDIENVGKTARHHTFFEMMGNFSIGDYFKKEAINFWYELLTSKEYFGMDINLLYITYYPTDLDALKYWLGLGVKEDHLIPLNGNFWEIGAGPSGPCTELFYDRGEKYDKRGPELIVNDLENDRYIEIGNIVFSQYNADPKVDRSQYKELPNKNIDTGAGLERFACVLQQTETNFETDLHYPVILATQDLSGVKYSGQMAFKVISDHIKTLTFSISDGATLSNEGRGYVLRRILRRAVKYGRTIGFNEPFLYKLVDTVVDMMGSFYKGLYDTKEIVKKIILKEEAKFFSTIQDGEKHLLSSIKDGKLSGEDTFKLYDTYGFPIELTLEYAEENNVVVDTEGFKNALNEQKERSRSARVNKGSMKSQDEAYLNFTDKSEFVGYEESMVEAKVIKVFEQGIVLDKTPFYPLMGGQVADHGTINGLVVEDVIKLPHGQYLHVIETDSFNELDDVLAIIDQDRRLLTSRNHTATHLLHQAIKDVIGDHSHQQGSYNGPNKLTFDVNHYESITQEQIVKIEQIVKNKIRESLEVITKELPIDEAKKTGANMLFGEKYGDFVRVVSIDDWSIEFCGGTHVKNTKEIEGFMITSVESIGSGIFRFEAFTNNVETNSINHLSNQNDTINQLIQKANEIDSSFTVKEKPVLVGSYNDILNYRNYIVLLSNDVKQLEKNMEQKKINDVLAKADDLIPNIIKEVTYIVTNGIVQAGLKPLIDVLYDKIKTKAIVLINISNEKASFLVKTNLEINAKELISKIASSTNGNGGGRPDFAQGGTSNLLLLEEFLKGVK